MSRYRNTNIKYMSKGKKRFSTTIYDEVPERDDDMYFISQQGDRCDTLAHQFYEDPQLWWFIARVNHLTTMNIPPGTRLRIPVSINNAKGL